MAMKEHFTFSRAPELELYLQIHHLYHHVMPRALISLSLSLVPRLYHPSHPVGLPVSVQSWCRQVLADRQTLSRPCKGPHWRTSLMSSSLLLLQCPACLVRLIRMVFEMGRRWLYSSCFVGCCLQDLFNTARCILVQLPSSFFSIHLVSVHVVHSYSSMDMTTAWKKYALFYCIGLTSI